LTHNFERSVLDLLLMVEEGPQQHGEAILALLGSEVDYQFHVPTAETVHGPQAVLAELIRQTGHYSDLQFEIRTVTANADRVIIERHDSFVLASTKDRVAYPVAAIFDTGPDGKIIAWREYWDKNSLIQAE
jgi:limonene-1,2-epoxide hydrolase